MQSSMARMPIAPVIPASSTQKADTVCEKPSSSKLRGWMQGILVPHQSFFIRFRTPEEAILVSL